MDTDKEVIYLHLDDIIPNRFQPREVFDERALKELAVSIKEHGVIQPIIVRQIKSNNKYEIIINKANAVSQDIIKEYTIVDVYDNAIKGIKLEEETYLNYLKLKNNLLERGYYINIRNGFRTFNDSSNIYNSYVKEKGLNYAKKYVAKPGTSEHNTGLAFDFIITNNKNSLKTNYESDEYFYLENIAYLYGFIIRYPKDKEEISGYNYEPWHLRYVGQRLAKYLKKNNLTLEEYYETRR